MSRHVASRSESRPIAIPRFAGLVDVIGCLMAARRGIGLSFHLPFARPGSPGQRAIQIPGCPVESLVAGQIVEIRFVRAVALVGYSRPPESVLGPVARLVDYRWWPATDLAVRHLGFHYLLDLVPVDLPDPLASHE